MFDQLSINGRRWQLVEPPANQIALLKQAHGLSEFAAKILAGRGISPDEVVHYLNPSLKHSLPDPSHLKDMDVAVERIIQAIEAKESITVFGDYDVDGATSSALLKRYFRMIGIEAGIYIPDRIEEGYGPNVPALLKLREQGTDLLITVDCGTLSGDVFAAVKPSGLQVIIIDHHLSGDVLPDVAAVVNPNRLDETSPHRNLAAVGVSFLLTVALNRALRQAGYFQHQPEPDLLSLLDLVALGTVCDVMTLTGLNRPYVAQGLKMLGQRRNVGLAALSDVAGINDAPTTYHLGYVLGPRINAGGRIGTADLGAKLLTTEDPLEARDIANQLHHLNAERRTIEVQVMEEAMIQAELQHNHPLIMVAGDGWHPGVIGIVASRLKERYSKPAIVVAFEGNMGKASGRSVPGLDLGSLVISAYQQGFLAKGGGHAMAAGFTVMRDKFEAASEYFQAQCAAFTGEEAPVQIDHCISPDALFSEATEALGRLAPFGNGNPEPILAIANCHIIKASIVGGSHVRVIAKDGQAPNGTTFSAIAFKAVDTPLGDALLKTDRKLMHLCGTLRAGNTNYPKPSLVIQDGLLA